MDALLEERAAVSEVLKLFMSLFDGPPPPAVASSLLESVFPRLRETLNLDDPREPILSGDFQDEYEPLFLIPPPVAPVSPYTSRYRSDESGRGDEYDSELVTLGLALGLPWKKEEFIPGRAYPVAPHHLSVLFGFLSVLVILDPAVDILQKTAQEWNHTLLGDVYGALAQMEGVLRDSSRLYPAYTEVIRIGCAYVRECQSFL